MMAKFYVQSGPVRLVFGARNARQAAVKAFQWSCDKQVTIDTDCPLEHLRTAERNGWQLDETITVSERGFGPVGRLVFDTLEIVAAWQEASFSDECCRSAGKRRRGPSL